MFTRNPGRSTPAPDAFDIGRARTGFGAAEFGHQRGVLGLRLLHFARIERALR